MEPKNSGGSAGNYGASEGTVKFEVEVHLEQFLIVIYFSL